MEIKKIIFSSLISSFRKAQEYFSYKDIYILISGFVPKFSAFCPTGSFKDYISTYSLFFLKGKKLVVASAGNVARAFAYAASKFKKDVFIFTPKYALENLKIPILPSKTLKVFEVKGTYEDAIELAKKFVKKNPFKYSLERGPKNRYRILGLSRLFEKVLKYVKFDAYFQAVSGGVGPLSLLYTCKKLKIPYPRLFLSQNLPYAPLYSYINRENLSKEDEKKVLAKVLTNAKANFKLLENIINLTKGVVLGINNKEILSIKKDWEEILGVDIDYSVAVTLASVKKAISEKLIKNEKILVHITGAGYSLVKKYPIKPFKSLNSKK